MIDCIEENMHAVHTYNNNIINLDDLRSLGEPSHFRSVTVLQNNLFTIEKKGMHARREMEAGGGRMGDQFLNDILYT